jgi:hypothetical protein
VVGLELVAGYLVAWVVRKARRAGQRLDEETDEVMDAGLDRLHEVVMAKLGSDPALVKLETDASQGLEPSERTVQRVQYAVEEATEEDSQFAMVIEQVLAQLEEIRDAAPSLAGIDLRHAKGVQIGNFTTQTNTFN